MISPKLSLDFSAATSPIAGMGDAARSALVNPAPAVRLASAGRARALRTNARRLGAADIVSVAIGAKTRAVRSEGGIPPGREPTARWLRRVKPPVHMSTDEARAV